MARKGLAIPRYRAFHGPALLSQGFRPFFLLAGLWAAGAMLLWLGWLVAGWQLPLAMPGALWHGHEMLFGYLCAALAGFLLTTIPNWTGRMPLQGRGLAVLVGLWGLGRIVLVAGSGLPALLVAAADLAFLLALLLVVAREVLGGRNWRNLPFIAAVAALLAANLAVHTGAMAGFDPRLGLRAGVGIFIVLIALAGGRIVPSFTRNWLVKRGHGRHPARYGAGDMIALLATLAAAPGLIVAPQSAVAGALAAVATLGNGWRLSRWRGLATWREPLLAVLHVGYAWLPLGFALMAASAFWPGIAPTAALHAMTAGAMGTMTLAVMTRTSLSHTGRAPLADGATTLAFAFVTVAAGLRIAGALAPEAAAVLHAAAGTAWILAFGLYLAAYAPKLLTRRAKG